MSLRINNNPASVNGIKNLQKNSMMVGKSMEKLSSGLRINRAADDAAGLIISEQMRAQITGLNTAISNSETAVNMVQTAEGALDEMNTLLNKARSLALQAANEGANDTAQIAASQSELNNIIDSVTRIAENTQFGTKKILDGSLDAFKSNNATVASTKTGDHYSQSLENETIQRGYHTLQITTAASKATFTLGNLSGAGLIAGSISTTAEFVEDFSFTVNGNRVDVTEGQQVSDLVANLNALGKEAGFVVQGSITGGIVLEAQEYGSNTNIEFALDAAASHTGATSLSGSFERGVDMQATLYLLSGSSEVGATATTGSVAVALTGGTGLVLESALTGAAAGYRIEMSSNDIGTGALTLQGAIDGTTSGATFQVGANRCQTVTVDLASMRANDIGTGIDNTYNSFESLKAGSLTGGSADVALGVIDKTIDDITQQRGRLGAFQANTLETGINSLKVTRENLVSAESTVRDVDFAVESANFTKLQIMVQSSTAMLAQANQLPQNVLQLLG
jgi:flagellin